MEYRNNIVSWVQYRDIESWHVGIITPLVVTKSTTEKKTHRMDIFIFIIYLLLSNWMLTFMYLQMK